MRPGGIHVVKITVLEPGCPWTYDACTSQCGFSFMPGIDDFHVNAFPRQMVSGARSKNAGTNYQGFHIYSQC
jgi:hypothetical protein